MEPNEQNEEIQEENADQVAASEEENLSEGDETPSDDAQEHSDEDIPTIENDKGEKFIPLKAFEARIGKLTSQRHEAEDKVSQLESIISEIKSNPEAKKKFAEAAGLPTEPQAKAGKLTEFIQSLPQEQREPISKLSQALAHDIIAVVADRWEQEMGPIRSTIGRNAVESFYQKTPDAKKYESQIAEIMHTGRAKNIADAYVLAAKDDLFNQGKKAGINSLQQRKNKLNKTPITAPDKSGSRTTHKSNMNIDEGIAKALNMPR